VARAAVLDEELLARDDVDLALVLGQGAGVDGQPGREDRGSRKRRAQGMAGRHPPHRSAELYPLASMA
jgi:hypothetical protein